MLRVSSNSGEEGGGIGEVSEDSNAVVDQKGIYGYDQEILDREAAEAPFRRLRLIAYGLFALIALILGIISLAGSAGMKEAKGLSENLPNPLLDAGVLGLAYYLWVEEVKVKRSALRLMEKRRQEELQVPNRESRRRQKSKRQPKTSVAAGASVAADAPTEPPPSASAPPPARDSVADATATGEKGSGLFGGLRKTLEEVNQQSYYQALALNKDLEERGILPPVERQPPITSSGDQARAEQDPPAQAGDVDNGSGSGQVGAEAVGSVRQGVAGRTKQGKRRAGKKGKRGK